MSMYEPHIEMCNKTNYCLLIRFAIRKKKKAGKKKIMVY